jgi:hypothetical protein
MFNVHIQRIFDLAIAKNGKTMIYRRGECCVELKAYQAAAKNEAVIDRNIEIQNERWDFFVKSDDLIFEGEPIDPAIGDVIEETPEKKYEVVFSGTDSWSNVDSEGVMIRIKTQKL